MASSSKTTSAFLSDRLFKYDVFLNFRGPDTRRSITSEIYDRLQNRGIKTFMDDTDLRVGDAISSRLLTAIEESRFAIVVLSPNYALSTWCLDELAKICQCMDNGRIFPLFYNVNPTDVRYQKMTFEEAFIKHEQSGRHEPEKVKQWKDALNKVATFLGWHTIYFKTDRLLADSIVDTVCTILLPTPFQSTGDFTQFEATRQAMYQVMEALQDNMVTAIGVYGMGGVGKTTLVTHVGQEARRQGLFDHVILVRVNQTPDLRKIQGMLADGLGIRIMMETEDGRASRLSTEIMRRNKILIILDNVWEYIDLPSIGIPSYDMLQRCNSKVLLTTRIWNVCHVMKSQTSITLNSLSEEDSWTLFVNYARKSFDSSDFEDIARKVARECGGLPIALIAVARALGDKDFSDWEQAAEQLEKSKAANLDQKGDATECIKLSYDFLKDEDSKSCFLLCCLFPEDYDIQLEDLFKYAVGKGLFGDVDTIQEARTKVGLVAKHLKNSNLLLNSVYDGCVRMHDVIRDTAIQITQSEDEPRFLVKAGCGLKNWPSRLHEGYSAISLMKNDIRKLPQQLVCPKLQILLLQENDDLDHIPDTFFKNTSELGVIDLSYTSISSLSKSFIHLSNLQGLYLNSCHKIFDLSILKYFKKLEILSMKQYPLKELSAEIGDLINLRVLDVTGLSLVGGGIVIIPSGVISKLHKLEELYLQCGFWDWGSRVEGEGETTNVSFDEVITLSYLYSLKICISDADCIPNNVSVYPSWTFFDICIGRNINTRNIIRDLHNQFWLNEHRYSKSLVLDTSISKLPAWFVIVVTKNTEKLTYVNFIDVNNILMEYHHGRLHSLKHLSVIGANGIFESLISVDRKTRSRKKPVFEKLEELHLVSMNSLKELCFGELPSKSLLNLKVLKVSDCPNLGNVLLPSKLLQRLANLENLFCKCMPGMEYLFGCEGSGLEQSKLSEVKLMELHAIRSICYGPAPPAMFQALNILFIYQCNFLGGLFTFEVAQCLVQVEDISIESCPNLESLIEASRESEVSKKTVLPKLKSLLLVALPMFYSTGAAIDVECPSLQQLYVGNCPHFSASAYDFGSKNQVELNDPLHYLEKRMARSPSPWNTDSIFKDVGVKMSTSIEKELQPNMSELLEVIKRPEATDWMTEFSVNLPEMIMEKTPKVVERIPRSLVKKLPEVLQMMPEVLDKVTEFLATKMPGGPGSEPDLMEKLPGMMNHLPQVMDKMTESMQHLHRLMEKAPGITEYFPTLVEMFPEMIQSMDLNGLMEKMPEILENFPRLVENHPQTEPLENLPQNLTELLSMFEGVTQNTESDSNSAEK